MYSIIQTKRDPPTFDIMWEEYLAFTIRKEDNNTVITYDTSNEYLPAEYAYSFMEHALLNIPVLSKDIKLETGGIYKSELKLAININTIVELFKFN